MGGNGTLLRTVRLFGRRSSRAKSDIDPPRGIAGFDVLRVVLGGVLLAAAGLKTYSLAAQPVLGTGLLNARLFLTGVIEFEIFLGVWLLAGVYRGWAWLAAVLCFGTFAAVSLYKALSGEPSCHCMGPIATDPRWMAAFDLAAVAALLRWRPARRQSSRARRPIRAAAMFVIGFVVVLPLTSAVENLRGSRIGATGSSGGGGNAILLGPETMVVLKPASWVGRRCPLLKYIDIPSLAQGRWAVVLYRGNCPHCQQAMPKYERLAAELARGPKAISVAMVEMPPYTHAGAKLLPTGRFRLGKLAAAREWFLDTPATMLLEDGVVVDACAGDTEGTVLREGLVEIGEPERGLGGP